MTEGDVAEATRQMFMVIVKLGALPLLAVLAVGLAVAMLQAVTQVNEQTLALVPKLIALIVVLVLGEHFLFSALAEYTTATYGGIVLAGSR